MIIQKSLVIKILIKLIKVLKSCYTELFTIRNIIKFVTVFTCIFVKFLDSFCNHHKLCILHFINKNNHIFKGMPFYICNKNIKINIFLFKYVTFFSNKESYQRKYPSWNFAHKSKVMLNLSLVNSSLSFVKQYSA